MSFSKVARRQEKEDEKEYKRNIKEFIADTKERKKSGYIQTHAEMQDTESRLMNLARQAEDIKRYSGSTKDTREAYKMYNKAAKSEYNYRQATDNKMRVGVTDRYSGTSKTADNMSAASSASKTGPFLGGNDPRANMQRGINAADRAAYDRFTKQQKERSELESLSAKDLKYRIDEIDKRQKQLADRKGYISNSTQRKPNLSNADVANMKNELAKLDKEYEALENEKSKYKTELPNAAARAEESKLSDAEKNTLELYTNLKRSTRNNIDNGLVDTAISVIGNVAGTRLGGAPAADAIKAWQGEKNVKNEEKYQKEFDKMREKGIDVDYLLQYYKTKKDNEEQEQINRFNEKLAGSNVLTGIANSAASVIASPLAGIQGLGEDIRHMVSSDDEKPLPVNQMNRSLANYNQSARKGVSDKIDNKVWNFIYNAGMSTADSAAAIGIGLATGGSGALGSAVTQGLMSVGAADNTYNEAIERGIDPGRAMVTGILAGVTEWVTEKYSIDGLKSMALKRPDNIRTLVKNIGKQMATEGSEEAASDVMNTIVDNVVNGKKSEFNLNVKRYKEQGLDSKQAKKAAMMDWLGNTVQDAAAGAVSGFLMGAGGSVAGYRNNQNSMKQYGENIDKIGDKEGVIEYAKRFDDLAESASEVENKSSKKSDKNTGFLADALDTKLSEVIDSAESATQLQDAYNELSENAPQSVQTMIDEKVSNKARELSNGAESGEARLLNRVADMAEESYNANMDEIRSKLDDTEDITDEEGEKEAPALKAVGADATAESFNESEGSVEGVANETTSENDLRSQKVAPKVFNNTHATLDASGESVKIDGFVDIGTDKVKVKIDGTNDTVDLSELKFDSREVASLYNAAARMDDAAAASAMISNYNGRMDITKYYQEFEKAYNWGSIGYDFDEMYKRSPFSISKDIAYQAYALGHNAYEASREEALNRSENVRTGKVSFRKGEGKVINERRDAEDLERGIYEHIDEKLAKKLGINIREVDQTNKDINEKINGFLDINNAEMVFSDAAQSDFGVRIHESLELLDAVDPGTYNSLMKYVLGWGMTQDNATSNDSIYDAIMQYRDTYRGVEGSKTFAEAAGEYMNDCISGIFFSEDGAKDFIEWLNKEEVGEAEKKGILKTIVEIIDKMINALKESLSRTHMTKAQKQAATMKLNTQKAIREIFFRAMDIGAETYKGSTGESANQGKAASAKVSHSVEVLPDGTESENNAIENQKKVAKDSEGRTLTPEQQEFFKDSKIKDEQGRLIRVYHGTPYGGFTEFKNDLNYYTANKEYADRYQEPSASSVRGRYDEATNRMTYEGYLNITHPFDISDPETRKIFIDEYIKGGWSFSIDPSLSGSEIEKRIADGIDWTEADNIKDFIDENELKYDGIILNEGADGGYGEEVSYRGLSYVTFASNQFKNIDNETPTKNPDIRFSLKVPVEETKNLIAVHNLSESKLMESLNLGGFPMPSIAITKKNMNHENFGDISVVFRKETIDPANRDNTVFSSDAYTARFPEIDYIPNEDDLHNLAEELNTSASSLEANAFNRGPKEDIVRGLSTMPVVRNKFIKDKNIKVTPAKRIPDTSMLENGEIGAKIAVYLITNGLSFKDLVENKKSREEVLSIARGDENSAAFIKKRRTARAKMIEKRLLKAAEDEESFKRIETAFNKDIDIINGTAEEEDYEGGYRDGVNNAIKEHREEFDKYVGKMADRVRVTPWIRNQKDRFNRDGSERSFNELHLEYTLDNIVNVMRALGDEAVENASPYGMFTGASTDKLSSIDDIHAEEGRIAEMSPEEYDEVTKAYAERFLDIAKEIANDPDDFYVVDGTAEGIVEALKSSKTKQGVLKALKEYSDNVTLAAVDKIFELKDEIRRMPTIYLEAKPKRAVGLGEIAGVAIPADASEELKKELKEKNIPFETYDEYNGRSRVDAVNSFDGIHFSIDVADTKDLIRENTQLKEMVEKLQQEFEITGGTKPNPATIKRVANKVLSQYNSSYDVDELVNDITSIYSYLRSENADGEVALKKMSEVAQVILDKGGDVVDNYAELRDYLKKTAITFTDEQKSEIANAFESFGAFRNSLMGKVKISNKGTSLEDAWNSDLRHIAPELFSQDVSAEEMPLILADVIDAIQPRVIAYGNESAEQGAYDLAMQIYTELAKVKPMQTFADKQAAKFYEAMRNVSEGYEKMLEEYRKQIAEDNKEDLQAAAEEFKNEKRRRIAENQSEMKALLEGKKNAKNPKTLADYEKRFKRLEAENARLKKLKDEEVARIRAKYNNRRHADMERRKSTETKNKIRKLHDRFSRMILKPTETMYVPKDLMSAAVAVCNVVNPGYGEGTKLRKALDEARRSFPKVSEEDGILASDFDPRIESEIDELARIFDEKPEGWSIKDASLEELNRIYDAMNGVYECIRMSTKLIREEGEKDARKAGLKWMEELRESKGLNTALGKLADKVSSSLLNSYREFRKICGYNDNGEIMETWKELNHGQRDMFDAQLEASNLLNEAYGDSKAVTKMLSELDSDLVKVPLKFESGNAPVMVTRGMRLSLIMHGQSQANMRHMMLGGVNIPVNLKTKDKKKRYETMRKVKGINYEAIRQMEMQLTSEERVILDAMKKLFWEWSGEKINETSNKLYGFERARVKNYFPITVNKDYVAADISALKFDKTIEGAGFLKERVTSNNPIILDNILDVAEKTIHSTSLFYGLAIPIRNFNKIINTGSYELSEVEGDDASKVLNTTNDKKLYYVPTDSVKQALREKWGMTARNYIDNLIADLQQARSKDFTWYDRLRGNYASAVLTANASVIIKQTSAYPTVAGITGWGPTVKAMLRGGIHNHPLSKADVELINKYTPLYWYRNQGNNSRDFAEIRDMDSTINKIPPVKFAKDLIQKVDIAMVGRFWYAAQYYVDSNYKDLAAGKNGTEEQKDAYYRKVAEVFDRAVEETQSTNMVMQNADIMRNPAGAMKMITMFMGQGLQNFGIVYDNLANMRAKEKQFKEGKCTKEVLSRARKDFANALSSQIVSAAMFAGLAVVARALLHRMNPYRDDKEEVTAESIAKRFSEDMLENIIGSVPFGSLIYETVNGLASNKGAYGVYGQQDVVLESLNDLQKSFQKLGKSIVSGENIPASLNQFLKDGSKVIGIPYENVWNLGEGIFKHVQDVVNGDGFLSFSSDQKDPKEKVIAGYLNEAIINKDKYSQEKYCGLLYELGESGEDINGRLAKMIKGDEAIVNAANDKVNGKFDSYESTIKEYKEKGYPEAAVSKAIDKIVEDMVGKKKKKEDINPDKIKEISGSYMKSLDSDVKLYKNNDLVSAVESGKYANVLKKLYDEKVKEYTDKGLSKEEAKKESKTNIKKALSGEYHKKYLEEGLTTHQRQQIVNKLSKIKVDGTPVYNQKDFEGWFKELKKA